MCTIWSLRDPLIRDLLNTYTQELLPYKELFTTVVLEQVLVAAATSCFRVCSSCHSCYGGI